MSPDKKIQTRICQLEKMIVQFKTRMEEKAVKRRNWTNWDKTFDAIDDWICIIDLNSTILRSNRTVEKYFQLRVEETIGLTCCKLVHGTDTPINSCPLPKMLKTKKRESTEVTIENGSWMLITLDPIFNGNGDLVKVVHIARDITLSKLIQKEREILVQELKKALTRIKTLSGMLPICSNCKKIRDDKGYWNLIESYIASHSEAQFSHGMCPSCMDELYGEELWYIDMKKKKKIYNH